jgi:hypothetical protein
LLYQRIPNVVGRVRFELTTIRLKVECSTTELPAHVAGLKVTLAKRRGP